MKPPTLLKLLRQVSPKAPTRNNNSDVGFTIVELAVVVVVIGILSAIAAPGWLAFTNGQRLRVSTDRVYSALRRAQSEAKLKKETWQVSFREVSYADLNNNGTQDDDEPVDRVQWAVHPETYAVADLDVVSLSDGNALYGWNTLEQGVEIETATDYTDLTLDAAGNYTAQFDRSGAVEKEQRITLKHADMGDTKRCVIVATILGSLRSAQNSECDKNP